MVTIIVIIGLVALIIILSALIWNMIDRIRGKKEETKKSLAIEELTNAQNQLIKTIRQKL